MIVATEKLAARSTHRARCCSKQEQAALQERARRLLQTEIEFIDNALFRDPAGAAAEPDPHSPGNNPRLAIASDEQLHQLRDAGTLTALCSAPVLKPAQEADLFCRMNLAKFRAHVLRQRIDDAHPVRETIERAEQWLAEALQLRNLLVQSNLRLVVSIAKRFAGSRYSLDDLIDEGVFALIRSVEKFDFDRGFRFSTYATRAVQRALMRWVTQRREEDERFRATPEEALSASMGEAPAAAFSQHRWEQLQKALRAMLAQLDEREQEIVQARFALGDENKVQTLSKLAVKFGVCKERIRQLEKRAIDKLRILAEEMHIEAAEV